MLQLSPQQLALLRQILDRESEQVQQNLDQEDLIDPTTERRRYQVEMEALRWAIQRQSTPA